MAFNVRTWECDACGEESLTFDDAKAHVCPAASAATIEAIPDTRTAAPSRRVVAEERLAVAEPDEVVSDLQIQEILKKRAGPRGWIRRLRALRAHPEGVFVRGDGRRSYIVIPGETCSCDDMKWRAWRKKSCKHMRRYALRFAVSHLQRIYRGHAARKRVAALRKYNSARTTVALGLQRLWHASDWSHTWYFENSCDESAYRTGSEGCMELKWFCQCQEDPHPAAVRRFEEYMRQHPEEYSTEPSQVVGYFAQVRALKEAGEDWTLLVYEHGEGKDYVRYSYGGSPCATSVEFGMWAYVEYVVGVGNNAPATKEGG